MSIPRSVTANALGLSFLPFRRKLSYFGRSSKYVNHPCLTYSSGILRREIRIFFSLRNFKNFIVRPGNFENSFASLSVYSFLRSFLTLLFSLFIIFIHYNVFTFRAYRVFGEAFFNALFQIGYTFNCN